MIRLFRQVQYFMRRRRMESELAEEIEAHRAMRQRDLESNGMSHDDAVRASRRALGNVALAREDARRVWIWPWLESLAQDTRHAIRGLYRQPGFTVVAVVTLALAIGLNTSLFTVFSAFAYRQWPVPESERVVRVSNGHGAGGFSLPAARYLSQHARTFEGLFAARSAGNNVIGEDDARVLWVTGDYFRVLRAGMTLGRPFGIDDDRPGAPASAVLSHGYWQRRFGGDMGIVGRTIAIEDVTITVRGVASREFTGTTSDRIDLYMPLATAVALRPNERWVRDELQRSGRAAGLAGSLSLGGRLASGATLAQAEAELTLLSAQFQAPAARGHRVSLRDTTVLGGPKSGDASAFWNMFGALGLVLLLACANVGNLLVARGAARRREMAVRLSLGASRGRLIRQLITESFVLACAGGVVGLVLAGSLPARLVAVFSDRPTALPLDPDGRVIVFALGVCAVASVLFGLAPALHATKASVAGALKDGARFPNLRFSLRSVLLSVQVALSVVLLAAAALLVRGVTHARALDHGFDLDGVSVVSLHVPSSRYDAARTRQFSVELEQQLSSIGGASIAMTQALPFGSGNIKGTFQLPDRGDEVFDNTVYDVTPRFFEVLGIPLVAGRLLTPADAGRPVVIVNESLARQFWTIEGAIGRRMLAPARGWNMPGELEIVGVVRDAHNTDLLKPAPTLYQPYTGRAIPAVLVRRPTAAAVAQIEAAVRRIDSRASTRVAPLSSTIDARLRAPRVTAAAASAVGLLALVLAAIGMFGVFAYWVQQRTQEIGIRMALGAAAPQVVRTVLGSSVRSIVIGLVIGVAGAGAASRVIRGSLYGLSPIDPWSYGAVLLLLSAAALLATIVPARRAARVDPLVALRHE